MVSLRLRAPPASGGAAYPPLHSPAQDYNRREGKLSPFTPFRIEVKGCLNRTGWPAELPRMFLSQALTGSSGLRSPTPRFVSSEEDYMPGINAVKGTTPTLQLFGTLFMLSLIAGLCVPLTAQTDTFTAGTGLWSHPANWSLNQVPGQSNDCVLPTGSVVTSDSAGICLNFT